MIEVIEAGLFTTVQDLGRYGYQRYGVPVSGALDTFAMRVANILVDNSEGDAGLEVTFLGPRMSFLEETVIAVTGGDLGPMLNGHPIPCWQSVVVPRGGVLSFSGARDGIRAYLAIAGGIDVPVVLGSRSTYTRSGLGGLGGRALAPGDRIPVATKGSPVQAGRGLAPPHIPSYGHIHILRVVLGPQDDAFTERGIATLLSSTYTVTPMFDRMGYRLEGETIEHKGGADIVSDGTPSGAVQVTGDGQPIVLLADRGTTGGYTKIATVVSVDLARIAQAQAGDTVAFRAVTLEQAHRELEEQEKLVRELAGPA
jgi:biotin-dependent carboxylase-like uncharacterized protein